VFLYIKGSVPLLKKRENMADWFTLGAAGAGAIGNLIGVGQQNQNQGDMMNLQAQNQMFLNNQMQNIQQQNWDYTNYENQRKHIEKAGLNVGMLYGMGGAGGSTMGGASGGSAAGGHAAQTPNFMEVGAQMLQAKAIESQTKLNDSTANYNNAKANEINSKLPKDIENIDADTGLKLNTTEGIKLDNELKKGNMETAWETSKQILSNLKAENEIKVNEGKITKVQAENSEELMRLEIAGKGLQNKLTEAMTNKEIQLTQESKDSIIQKYEQLKINWGTLTNEQRKTKIEQFVKETDAEYPSIWNVIGKGADVLTNGTENFLNWCFGVKERYIDPRKKVK
jgi:hypothetical protein